MAETKKEGVKRYSAWCHVCGEPFMYYSTDMDKPNYTCPKCNSDKHVTVP